MRKRWRFVLYAVIGVVIGTFAGLFASGILHVRRRAPEAPLRPIGESVQRGVAYHEGGHAVVAAYLSGPGKIEDIKVYTSLGDSRPFGVNDFTPEYKLSTADDIMREAGIFMGGRAADTIINGAPTTGAGSDLAHVNDLIWDLHLSSGLGGSLLVRSKAEAPKAMTAQVEKEIGDANACAEAIVSANADAVRLIGDEVMKRPAIDATRRLSGDEVRALLAKHPLADPPPEVQAKLMSACRAVRK